MDIKPTFETDAHSFEMESEDFDVELAKTYTLARKLERERDEARRNAEVERLSGIAVVKVCQSLERERDEARAQLYRICKEGFDNQDTIGLEPADDYVLRKLAELRQALSGRTVSCSQCNESARTIEEMREAIKEADSTLRKCIEYLLSMPIYGRNYKDIAREAETVDAAHKTLGKLKPLLK